MTEGAIILRSRNHLDGYVPVLPQGGNTIVNFTIAVSAVEIHNLTADIIEVVPTMILPITGNGIFYIAPFSAKVIETTPGAAFMSISITDSAILGEGGGRVIVNGLFG